MTKELFRKLFVLRDDVYAIQTAKGAYVPVEEKITDDVIQCHLDGTHTIGLYQLDGSKIKWACLDIDVDKVIWNDPDFKLEDWEDQLKEQADIAQVILEENGIPSYIEHSGNKGYHVWMFFQHPVEAAPIQKRMHELFDNMHQVHDDLHWEVFPKQTNVHSGYGNLVKGACGFHNKSKKFSKFVGEIPTLQSIKYAKAGDFYDVEPYKAVRYECRALKNEWDKAIETGEANNDLRFTLASMFVEMGPEAEQYMIDEFLSKMDNYDPKISNKRLAQIRNKDNGEDGKGYIPSRCDTMQNKGICDKPCNAIGNNVSPIAFHERELRKRGKSTDHIDPSNRFKTSAADAFDENNIENSLDKYVAHNHAYYKEVQRGKNVVWQKLSTFVMDVSKVLKIDDGQDTYTIYHGTLKSEAGEEIEVEINTDIYSDPSRFRAFIYKHLSPNSLLIDNVEDVRKAIQSNIDAEVIEVIKKFGYRYKEDSEIPYKYMSPSYVVTKEGVKRNEECIINLEGEDAAEHLDLEKIDKKKLHKLKEHIKEDLLALADPESTHTLLAYSMLPVVFPYIIAGSDRTRFGLFLRGTSGKGKSYLAIMFQHFYGNITKPASWTSTPNALGRIGYFFRDAVFVVDDYKKANIRKFNKDAVLSLIQNYADNTARARMKQNLELAKTYDIKGFLLTTGEDTPEGESSSLARMVFVTITQKNEGPQAKRCENMREEYSGFTAHFIKECLQKNPLEFKKVYEDFFDEFFAVLRGRANDTRIARNHAMLCTAYKFTCDFLYEDTKERKRQVDWFVASHKKRSLNATLEVSDELASTRFLQTLNELLSTRKAIIQESSTSNAGGDLGSEVIGYWAEPKSNSENQAVPHIMMGRAMELVQKNLSSSSSQIQHSKKAIISELYEHGYAIDGQEKSRKMNNSSVRIVRFKPQSILEDIDDEDTSLT